MSTRRYRVPAWIGVACLAVAGTAGVAALVTAGADSTELSAPAASLAAAPVTIPPAAHPPAPSDAVRPSSVPPSTTEAPPPPTASDSEPPATTLPSSPLAALLGDRSSALPVPPAPIAPPVRIRIDSLAVDVDVRAVGLENDGQLEIPDETEVGWYRLGAAPGEPGATVLAGHVNWHRTDGPFVRLRELEPGATVILTRSDGTTRTYQVTERQQYPKDQLPGDRIWTHTGPETLVLITCGGSFNPDIHRYRDNIVVYAVPIA